MKTALQLAESVKGQTYPNPPVGAVVVKNGQIVGLGAHLKSGESHAEVHAIEMAGEAVKKSTIYVTLEPCSHIGKTPSCADLIIAKEISRVVIATKDPNERVAGEGIKRLRRAGLDVIVGVLEEEAKHICDVFFHYIQTKRPFITLKSAISLDGKTATKTGESKWITSEAARRDVHHYRHIHDAILVGVNTILVDNPKLTTRLENGGKHPKRIILDTHLKTPFDSHIIQNGEAETIIFIGKEVPQQKIKQFKKYNHVKVIQLQTQNICVKDIIEILGKMEIASLFIEGGATVNDSFVRAGLINQYIVYIAPKLIGGKDAPTSVSGKGFATMDELLHLHIVDVETIGDDIKITAISKGETECVYGNR